MTARATETELRASVTQREAGAPRRGGVTSRGRRARSTTFYQGVESMIPAEVTWEGPSNFIQATPRAAFLPLSF